MGKKERKTRKREWVGGCRNVGLFETWYSFDFAEFV